MRNDLASERARHAVALEEDLEDLVRQLRGIPEVEKVVLFGSYLSGRRDLFTDLDLLVVMDSSLDFVARSAALAGRLRARVAVDLLVYTPQEMEQMRERSFVRDALAAGKVLYERGAA